MRRALGWLFACLWALPACTEFPTINANECGNAVVEDGEDCDTFPPFEGAVCRLPDRDGECHLDCRAGTNGERALCPTGWGCDLDGICRQPMRDYGPEFVTPSVEFEVGRVESLLAGDFDGDGRGDVVSREHADALNHARIRFHYFDELGALTDSRPFPKTTLAPIVRELSGDHRDDLVFNDGRIGLLRGRAQRDWIPAAFGTYVLDGAPVRLVSASDNDIQQVVAIVAFANIDEPGVYVPDSNTGRLRIASPRGLPTQDLVADPVSGDLLEDPERAPCREVVYAQRDASVFYVLNMCERSPQGQVKWRAELEPGTVSLDPPAPIRARPQLGDVDGDGHLDVVLATEQGLYLALGDGSGVQTARPFPVIADRPTGGTIDFSAQLPLAIVDLNRDQQTDLVFPSYWVLRKPPELITPSNTNQYVVAYASPSEPWSDVKVADFNGNGTFDLVAASSTGANLQFFNGVGDAVGFTLYPIETRTPVSQLEVGDFDLDLITDVAYIEQAAGADEPARLKIAYGVPFAAPQPSLIAELGRVDSFSSFMDGGFPSLGLAAASDSAGRPQSVVTLLGGSPDRLPFAPYELNNLSGDGSLESWFALGMAVGDFEVTGRHDLISLAALSHIGFEDSIFAFWSLRGFASSQSSPELLEGELDGQLDPAHGIGTEVRLQVSGLAADFDRDGRDEAVFAMPLRGGRGCGVIFARPVPTDDGYRVEFTQGTVELPEACPLAELAAVDADADGWLDLAVLSGGPDSAERSLFVLWNQHAGRFSASQRSAITPEGDSVRAFAVMKPADRVVPSFAYVTDHSVEVARAVAEEQGGARRAFSERSQIESVSGATGIAASDVNGDGLKDLVIAVGGDVRVLRAGLFVP